MSHPKIIMHVCEAWKGGISEYVEQLVNQQVIDGNKVYLVVDQKSEVSDNILSDAVIIRYKSSRSIAKLFFCAILLNKIIKKYSPHTVFTHSSFAGLYVRSLRKDNKIIHIPHSWSFQIKSSGVIKNFVYIAIEKVMARASDYIVCMSREEYMLAGKIGIDFNRLKLIHTGLKDTKRLEPDRESMFKVDGLNIGFVGRLDYQKGVDLLFQSIKRSSGINFHVVGESVRDQFIYEDLPNTKFYGWLDRERLNYFYNEMDYVIAPSRWEGFSLVPIESFRAGTGVIGSAGCSISEAIIDGFNGIFINELSVSGICEALEIAKYSDPVKIGCNSRSVYQSSYSFEDYFKKIRALYE